MRLAEPWTSYVNLKDGGKLTQESEDWFTTRGRTPKKKKFYRMNFLSSSFRKLNFSHLHCLQYFSAEEVTAQLGRDVNWCKQHQRMPGQKIDESPNGQGQMLSHISPPKSSPEEDDWSLLSGERRDCSVSGYIAWGRISLESC